MPLDMSVDVISVGSLAFKRFLEIAVLLKKQIAVVTDNDGDVAALQTKYADYAKQSTVGIHYDLDHAFPTLEPQLLKANGRFVIEGVLDRKFDDDAALLKYMHDNKTDVALKFFTTTKAWTVPQYILNAIQ